MPRIIFLYYHRPYRSSGIMSFVSVLMPPIYIHFKIFPAKFQHADEMHGAAASEISGRKISLAQHHHIKEPAAATHALLNSSGSTVQTIQIFKTISAAIKTTFDDIIYSLHIDISI